MLGNIQTIFLSVFDSILGKYWNKRWIYLQQSSNIVEMFRILNDENIAEIFRLDWNDFH